VALHRLEIEGLAAVAIFADELEMGQRAEHALGHRLEPDDGSITVLQNLDQLVFIEPMLDVVKLRMGVDLENLLPHGRIARDMIGGDAQLLELSHLELSHGDLLLSSS